jgi:hypothetical protein
VDFHHLRLAGLLALQQCTQLTSMTQPFRELQ